MSSLWTPEGEHRVPPRPPDAEPRSSPTPAGAPDDAAAPGRSSTAAQEDTDQHALAAGLEELTRQLVSTPAEVVVANHAYGLFELAAIHLSQRPPGLSEAHLAIDALGVLVEGLAGRLGEAEPSLVDALAQIRLAFVQIQATAEPGAGAAVSGDVPEGSAGNDAG